MRGRKGRAKKDTVTLVHDIEDLCSDDSHEAKEECTGTGVQEVVDHRMDYHSFAQEEIKGLRSQLLDWYDKNQRIMPWRKPSKSFIENSKKGQARSEEWESRGWDHAYGVLVSEIMLQQTQVSTVVSYFERWMKKWPTVKDLSEATQEEVNELWAGLGYYRRAKFLRDCAIELQKNYGGKIPETPETLLKLPGVGKYTAGAVASIVYGKVTPLVDGNVIRVLTRLRAIGADVKQTQTINHFWKLAEAIVDPERPGEFNQSLMELGATVCSVKDPSCGTCPVRGFCHALKEVSNNGKTETDSNKQKTKMDSKPCTLCRAKLEPTASVTKYPIKSKKKAPREQDTIVCVLSIVNPTTDEEKFLLVQRPPTGLLAGFWEFPSLDISEKVDYEAQQSQDDKNISEVLSATNPGLIDFLNTRKKSTKSNKRPASIFDGIGECERFFVGETVHVFSHIRQTLYVERMKVKLESNEVFQFLNSNAGIQGDNIVVLDSSEDKTTNTKPKQNANASTKKQKSKDKTEDELRAKWVSESEFKEMAVSKGTKKCFALDHEKQQKERKKSTPTKKSPSQNKRKTREETGYEGTAAKKRKTGETKTQPKIDSIFKRSLK